MIWPRLAEASIVEIAATIAAQPRRLGTAATLVPLTPTIAAVERMSDATGMYQHAIFSIPDRRHGYCIDDNARALMLMHAVDDLDEDARDKWTRPRKYAHCGCWNCPCWYFRPSASFAANMRSAACAQ